MIRVCVLGLGYIGLPTVALIASQGVSVHGVDVQQRLVEGVNSGDAHIAEPGLAEMVSAASRSGHLTASMRPESADVHIIAVPTPLSKDRQPELNNVFAAVDSIAPFLAPGQLVILESTSPVGTTALIAERLAAFRPDLAMPGQPVPDLAIAYCPERVLPGRIMEELVKNDRCVGGITPACAERAASFYERFVQGTVLRTTAATAELVKLTENAFRDVNIAFANEMSMVAERAGVDVWELIALANRHPRVNVLRPGPGVGGHCIAVDPWFFVHAAPEEARLIRTAREVDDHKAQHVRNRVSAAARADPAAPITCFGLAFKADVGDLRESPALEIATHLAQDFPGRVALVEPFIEALPPGLDAPLLPLATALGRQGIFVLLVDHTDFRQVPTDRLGM